MDPPNTQEKTILTHKIPMRENLRPTNTHEKILDPPNTHENKFQTLETPTRKNFGHTKYPQENILDPRYTHEKKFWTQEIPTKGRWHDSTKPTRPTIARDPRNLANSLKLQFFASPILQCQIELIQVILQHRTVTRDFNP